MLPSRHQLKETCSCRGGLLADETCGCVSPSIFISQKTSCSPFGAVSRSCDELMETSDGVARHS